MPGRVQEAIAAGIGDVTRWKKALFEEPTPLAAFAHLECPVLLMTGETSPVASRSVAKLLASVLPAVESRCLPGVGHMGPVTHPDTVNQAIADFLSHTP